MKPRFGLQARFLALVAVALLVAIAAIVIVPAKPVGDGRTH